ncbi:aminotransferase class V-fold PLP-dependent enzyme [Flavobacteriaceae bacterium AU392]|nr:aminotransferase class V-fold PLP-dependent enzyme [Flavobacteriaceae bacterium]RKM86066.1 aminotransferase class V-fold PLP-dependent enzyme [Flavobacteriaceae bacterium AU392]
MQNIKERILELQSISEALEPSELRRKEYIKEASDYANNFVNNLNGVNAFSDEKVTPNIFKLNPKKKSLRDIIELYDREVASKGIKPASGAHLGYIPGGGIYTSSIADYLAAITNEYAGIHYASPGGVEIENELIDWMKTIFGFPKNAIGNLTSGGSIANLIALTAARDKKNIKGNLIESSVIYVSEQLHHCIFKALQIIGLSDIVIRYLELDDNFKIIPEDITSKIEIDIANGLNPFMIIASAGTTDTGAIDPLNEIGLIAEKHNIWYHIDGAYGGFFILTEQRKSLFKGIELADSLVVDPHKSLFLPYGIGTVLIKDRQAVYQSNQYTANYMQDAINENMPVNPADVSPELTKHFRGLRLWIPLQLHGIEPFIACLEEKLLLTTYFREQLMNCGFKVGPKPDLSVSYFWYPTNDDNENEFNERLMQEVHNNGKVFLSSTKINGKFVIRIAILSFRTKLETIDKAMMMIDKIRKKISDTIKTSQ